MNRIESTKQGIVRAKARGVVWGKYGAVIAARNKNDAQEFAESMRTTLVDLATDHGLVQSRLGPRPLARKLNEMGVSARNGGRWHPATVHRLLKRLGPSFKQECRQIRRTKLNEVLGRNSG